MRKQPSHWLIRALFAFALLTLVYYLTLKQNNPSAPLPLPSLGTAVGVVLGEPTTAGAPTPSGAITGAPGALPEVAAKPKPAEISFEGCPPEGDGGDSALNQLKNRVDDGTYLPVQFDALEQLKWPQAIERKRHAEWSSQQAADIAHYEGLPVAVEGYLAGAKEEGPESTNCHGADPRFRDFHVWLTSAAGQDRSAAVVVETTPRVRANHAGWTVAALEKIAQDGQRVRISGWLMFDPEHPEQIGKTRGTLWEIHPIMRIEVERQGQWVDLDRLASR